MKAIYLDSAKNLRESTAEEPTPGAGEALIRVHTMGICGSDIEYYLHGKIGSFVPVAPLVLGHEFAGEVVALGPDPISPVTGNPMPLKSAPGTGGFGVQVGSRVAIDPSIPCRVCEYCRSGRHNLCTNLRFVGTAATVPHINGGLAEYVKIPVANCYVVPEHLSWGEGACIEPLSVAVHAVLRPGTIAGATVLVTGGGTIGQFVALTARAMGASVVAVSDLQEYRVEFAREHGADYGIDPRNLDEMARVMEETGGFELIFEASGAPPAVRANIELVKRGGTIVQIGSIGTDVELPANLIMAKELNYIGSFRYGDIYPVSLSLLASRRVDVRPLISTTYPLAESHAAFERAAERSEAIKVQVSHRL
jgi:L-idonate 5-dehydrogenase